MTIDSPEQLDALKAAGAVVKAMLDAMRDTVEPGVTTRELDEVGAAIAREAGAISGPQKFYNFPGFSCVSVNDEAVHGIPGDRVVAEGDLVKLDATVELDGYLADACITVGVPPLAPEAAKLMRVAESALELGILRARAGKPLNRIGKAVELEVVRNGFQVIRQLGGHGIGRHIHEDPRVASVYEPEVTLRLEEGMVFTIEPIIAVGTEEIRTLEDGWTIVTADGSLSAQFEHTVVVTRGKPVLLTA